MDKSAVSNNLYLVTKYWKKKTAGRDQVHRLQDKENSLPSVTIKAVDLNYFSKLTNGNPIAQATVLNAVYSFLLKKLNPEFDGYVVSDYKGQSHPLLFSFPEDLNSSFKEYLQKVKTEILETLQYSEFNPDDFSEKTGFSDLSIFSNYSIDINKVNPLACNGISFSIKINETEDIEITVSYLTDFVKKTIAVHLVQQFEQFLLNLENNITVHLSNYDLLSETEKRQLLVDFNATDAAYPKEKTIVDLFEEQVAKTPDNVAVVFKESNLTYSELNKKANQLARYISSNHTLNKGDIVGVFLPKSDNGIISLLAILKLGAVYLPIDTHYPQERIDYLIKDSGLKLLITDNAGDFSTCETIALPSVVFDRNSDENINTAISPRDLAYVIYTSGSTGHPKGVMIEHTSNINMALDQIKFFDIRKEDTIVWFASVAFDASISEIMMSLYSGATLCIPTEEVIKDKDQFILFLKATNATVVTFPPSYLGLLSEEDISGLRCVITAGEPANPTKAIAVVKSGIAYYNAYGPTECAVCVSIYKLSENDFDKTVIPIGKPISNTKIYILDEALQPVPIGVAGKIYVSGAGVGRGYLNKPELTQEKFIANPFETGERMYDTGDLGCWLPDGNIEFLGRKDFQVKIRGYRIELGEIENTILQYSDAVKQVVVEVKENRHEKVLAAYLVSTTPINKSELRSFLQNALPDYLVPGFYIALDQLPLTPNGKIDRKALPGITSDDVIRKTYVAPQNETEKSLAAIWEEVLGIEKIGITDNFFELGGHSLIIAQVINRTHKQLGKTVSFKTFFTSPSIAELSRHLQENSYLAIPKAPGAQSYPLTASQKRLWILSQLDGGTLAYNMPATVKLTGTVDAEKFEESFRLLLHRHEILRTAFKATEEGEVQQYIVPAEQVNFTIAEKDFSSEENTHEAIAGYLLHTNSQPFNLETAPLVRTSLIKVKEEEYVFFLSLHHIIGDGWSIELLIAEVVKTYNALLQGKKISFPELNIQYKDYAVWLKEELQNERQQESKEYWLAQFAGELPVLDLPGLNARPLVQTYNGDTITHQFSNTFLERLKGFSKEHDVTLFMTLMAGINVLLNRYTGQNDIIVGTPIAGREHPDLENQMGLYLNTLAIRTQLKEESNFLDVLTLQKETLLSTYDHQNYPFDELVGKLNLKRDTSRSVLFDVLVVLQNQEQLNNLNTEVLIDLEISKYEFKSKTSQFDVSFIFVEKEGLDLRIEYNTDIYDGYLIKRMFGHFENLMLKTLAQPEIQIQEVDYLTQEEKNHLLFDLNNTVIEYPSGKTVLDLFEEQVAKTPNNIAIVFKDTQLTYKELDDQSSQLAGYLAQNYTIEPDDLVGIILERSERMIVSIFGILKSGGAYVPMDVHYPQERVDFITRDAKLKLSINETEFAKFKSVQDSYSTKTPERGDLVNHLAYCIYTSGSTGNPKGVLNHHAGLYNRLVWMKDYLKVEEKEVFLQKTPYTFDVSVWELILPFLTGSSLVIAKPEGHKDVAYLQDIISKKQVSIVHFVPSMLGVFLLDADSEKGKSLAHIICSGEELPALMAQECKEKFVKAKLHNLYGPTEAAIDVTAINLSEIDVLKEGVSIGKPIANTSIYIVNNSLGLQPFGVPGELLISGIQVARGYLNLPELTQDRFIADPFRAGYQVYRTGDIAQWKPDGSIHYMGRIDNQVKIRGNRIELGEVENAIMAYGGIQQAVATPKEVNGEKVLVAYYLLDRGEEIDKAAMRTYLQGKLPEYMVPGFYVVLETLPMTSSGKVDRKALPGIGGDDLIRGEYVAPRNPTEEKLAVIWQDILGIDQIGITDNFFELGGDSIRAIRILAKINKELHINYKLADIYALPSIEKLLAIATERTASEIPEAIKAEVEAEFEKLEQEFNPYEFFEERQFLHENKEDSQHLNVPFSEEKIVSIYPMSDIELGMLFGSLATRNKGVYHDQFVFPLPTAQFDKEAFVKAISILTEKHEILRTAYNIEKYSSPVHLVYEKTAVRLAYENLSANPQEEIYSIINDFMVQERTHNSFVTSEPGLWRMKIYKTAEKEYSLLFQFHHAILDGWSVASLMTELNNIYLSVLENQEAATTQLALTYKDYVFEQHCIKKNEKYNDFWKENLSDYKKLDIFTEEHFSKRHDFTIEGALYDSVLQFSQGHGLSLKTIAFAAYLYTLKTLTYEDDITVGLVTSGRPLQEDADKILGCFLNTIPFRIKETNGTAISFAEKINELLTLQRQFERISLNELQTRFSVNKKGENPFFDTHFNYIDFHIYDDLKVQDNEKVSEFRFADLNFEATNTFLDLNIRPVANGIKASWNQQRALKYGLTIEQLQEYYTNFLSALVNSGDAVLKNECVLPESELQNLLYDLNNTTIEYPSGKTVLDLFEEQVAKTPDNIAIIFEDTQLTYKELDEQSSQLSGYLAQNYTIEPDDLVGIILERSERMIVSIFGILKSGGAYVPMDVHYPQERVDFITRDAKLKLSINEAEFAKFKSVQQGYPTTTPERGDLVNQLAYCIYTSGSTGNPKGVLNHHAGLYNRLVWMKDYLKVEDKEVFLQKTPYTFDVSVWELILPFLTGSSLVIAKPEGHKDVAYLQDIISKKQISIVHFVPSMLGVFLLDADSEKGKSLAHIICSGEELPALMAQECKEKFVKAKLHNLYGPTEAAIDVTAINLSEIDVLKEGVSIGKPIANTSIYIVNNSLGLQPFGVPGELLISGIQVARGYLNLPELTQDRFIADPFRAGHQVYRTGDIAQWKPDGSIHYMGRIDNQVKIRGNRIELGEVENAIMAYGGIQQAVATPKEVNGEKVLVAYYLLERGTEIDKAAMRAYLQGKLPEYMVPGFYVVLETLPMTSSGKVDRKALPGIGGDDLIRGEYVAPRNPTEEKLAVIWQDILGINQVGITDNFFELGGTSFQLIKLQKMIELLWPNKMVISDLFEFNSIKDIAVFITRDSGETDLEEKDEMKFFEI
ncbi:amino acid adenylation domain-containing protein [Flavobacterium cupreum]|uniref:Amino acid adenylation domain-containing protein n=3 Tax=Flavobacterium TaxID=237 RepID=A0A434A5F2_9FLAO|nr:non-ribosomal peptide synthetase [Flavobacterium cupreum]RUT69557.1 amino acid adenylation domain-containing protein [Flavobacterium cupreum]